MKIIKDIILLFLFFAFFTSCHLFYPRNNNQTSKKKTNQSSLPIHIMFTFADHWEPSYKDDISIRKANLWANEFKEIAMRHRDGDGVPPQHTWFCADLHKASLVIVSECVFDGLGEMEIHIHHGSPNDDTADNTADMARLIDKHIMNMKYYGACHTAEICPQTFFGFIHGNWSLDNSRVLEGHRQYCGVNRELDMLIQKKCYADFTFPSPAPMSPVNWTSKIMLSKDSSEPKSYDILENVRELKVGDAPQQKDELMLITGPALVSTDTEYPLSEPDVERFVQWYREGIHVQGRENWIFIKTFTHASQVSETKQGMDDIFGKTADKFYSDIEKYFNDRAIFKLHYVTAREMYNIAMAAQDGLDGDPNIYRNYLIKEPVNRKFFCDAQYNLKSYNKNEGVAELIVYENVSKLKIMTREFNKTDIVLEKFSERNEYKPTDAKILSNTEAALIIEDASPSHYYLIKRK